MEMHSSGVEAGYILEEISQARSLTSDPDVQEILESLDRAVRFSLEFEDRWWKPLSGVFGENENLLPLDAVKQLARKTEENTESNGLLRHGRELKTSHAVGVGFTFTFPESTKSKGKLMPRFQALLDDPINQEILFDDLALKAISDKEYTSGNVFIAWNVATKRAVRIPLSQITGAITDDADTSFVKYFQRTYSVINNLGNKVEEVREWLPVDLYWRTLPKSERPKTLPDGSGTGKRVSVNWDLPVVPFQPNRLDEQFLALPTCFAAVPWAVGYSHYLKGGAKLVDALSSIAFVLKSKKENEARKAAAQVVSGKTAGVAVGSEELELQQVPRANAVDLNTGRPLLSMVASALGLSTGSLATNVLEGGYASTAAVTAIEKSYAQTRQRAFEAFYRRIFFLMGLPDGEVNFNRLDADPIHRIIQSAGVARSMGFITQKEGRILSLELLDIDGDLNEIPEPDEFVWSKKGILPAFLTDDQELEDLNTDGSSSSGGGQGEDTTGSAVPSQGNSGSVGSLNV